MKRLFLFIGSLLIVASLTAPFALAADENVGPSEQSGLLIQCDKEQLNADGTITIVNKCTIEDFLNQFVVLAQWGQSFVIVLGMLFMVWGGVQWITAGGRASKIDEGKRIILGTIIGIIISFTAYIIINFAVSAITGTTKPGLNPFSGPIATVFGGQKGLEQSFSGGTGSLETRTNCRAQWDNTCSDQIYCADPGTAAGRITTLQKALNAKGCGCGNEDGCFGGNTATCVRKFQVANNLVPTGIADQTTETLALGTGVSCNDPAVSARATAVNNNLPAFSVQRAAGLSRTETGCCLVKKDINGTLQTLMCADLMSKRNCLALGENNVFVSGDRCLQNVTTKSECGFCLDYGGDKSCFQQVGKYWCDVYSQVTYRQGTCNANPECKPNSCYQTLYTAPPFTQ